jgi:rhamnogalacturonan endolyase
MHIHMRRTVFASTLCVLVAGCGGDATSTATGGATRMLAGTATASSFGLAQDANFYTIDTGAGLVFKVRRLDNGVSTQSAGDIASLVYNGVEYQDQGRGTQVNSGFDYLYKGVSAVDVSAEAVGSDVVKVTVQAGGLTHYYIARRGEAKIYMGTYFTSEPDTLNLARFIVRVPIARLPNGPAPSDLRGTSGAIEASDVFGMPNGETRSKHYSNMRLKDWQYIGATGANAGLWIVRDNNEGNSGGPFYRSLLNQATATNQEITYIINYGEGQTEPLRTKILNTYTMVFNDGAAPGPVDTSWLGTLGLTGWVGPEARGAVSGAAITGRDPRFAYTVGFANATAQYWAAAERPTAISPVPA